MAAITLIPDMLNVVEGDYRARTYVAGAAITRGTVIGLDTTGRAVPYPITGTPGPVKGVALDTVSTGMSCSVVYEGYVNVANADDTTAIAIGKAVHVATFAGAVILSAAGAETNVIGSVADTAIAGGSYGRILLSLR